ncbi:hypothetical protein ElyMa_000583000 [Elysia marginata]|uniref:Uncharacterized protein n=1 Tax=Elysia marginata TaxID=1093978 RepID=A0AAV4G4F7_9GAST|nr:hypothetical protein ElyMa_000583000 [Elysia marginata]
MVVLLRRGNFQPTRFSAHQTRHTAVASCSTSCITCMGLQCRILAQTRSHAHCDLSRLSIYPNRRERAAPFTQKSKVPRKSKKVKSRREGKASISAADAAYGLAGWFHCWRLLPVCSFCVITCRSKDRRERGCSQG